MDEKPKRRLFSFGLAAIFVLIALSGVLMRFWNPLAENEPSLSNLDQLRPGMTAGEVQALVGTPSKSIRHKNREGHAYPAGKAWVVLHYLNGRFTVAKHEPIRPKSKAIPR